MKHIGSKFDDFLKEENILAEVESNAIKRVLAFQLGLELTETSIIESDPWEDNLGKDIETGSSK